ncbi:roadblock/LC7 domain-containing protein [Kribbella sp. NPDC051952]|uniref:roadblock/LC7 domain-containing protein n=1 Tax=Kribbella sp. NPDC051952 TaxID=3154851 RepID=UPI0034399482
MSAEHLAAYIGDTATVRELLDTTKRSLTGVTGVMLAGADGRPVVHMLEPDQANAAAAICAASLSLGQRLADLVGPGRLSELTVRSPDGYVLLYAVGDKHVLMILTVPSANIARIHLACRDLRRELTGVAHPADAPAGDTPPPPD